MSIRDQILEESENHRRLLDPARCKKYGEVFTPTELVIDILCGLSKDVWHEGKTFLDPACGNGQFLAPVLLMKMRLGHKEPLKTIYGVDILEDNVQECRERLLDIAGHDPENIETVKRNIICDDTLRDGFTF